MQPIRRALWGAWIALCVVVVATCLAVANGELVAALMGAAAAAGWLCAVVATGRWALWRALAEDASERAIQAYGTDDD